LREKTVRPRLKAEIVTQNTFEDINLVRKWTHYSHYYAPYKKLNMRRSDSSTTILEATNELNKDQGKNYDNTVKMLGRIIHHLQDSASPPHVIPVQHGLGDGFEQLDSATTQLEEFLKNDLNDRGICEMAHQHIWNGHTSPLDLLQNSARQTYERVRNKFNYKLDGKEQMGQWSLFWEESLDNSFGSYGKWGNKFGIAQFEVEGHQIKISPNTYHQFKWLQISQAIKNSYYLLLWWHKTVPLFPVTSEKN